MQKLETLTTATPAKAGSMRAFLNWLKTPRGLIIGGIVIIAAGLALGWNWVVALGLAPLILSVAPCAAMCALGMCMMPKSKPAVAPPNAVDQPKLPQ